MKHQQHQAMMNQSSSAQLHQTPTPAAKMRPQKLSRPRPKTIHVETGSVDLSETSSLSSRGKKGSNSNLTGEYQRRCDEGHLFWNVSRRRFAFVSVVIFRISVLKAIEFRRDKIL